MKLFAPIALIIALLPHPAARAEISAAAPPHQVAPFKPTLTMPEAVKIVEGHVREQNIDLSKQYICSAALRYDDGTKRRGHYWHIQWAWTAPCMGGEYGLRIYMDGTVIPEPLGP